MKFQTFRDTIPELLALSGKYDNRPKVQFYEGLEGLKYVYEQIIVAGEAKVEKKPDFFPVFLGTTGIDPAFQRYLMEEFVPRRAKSLIEARVIIPKSSLACPYTQSNIQRNNYLVIDNVLFDINGEIILYGENKVLIAMYSSEELSAIVITSKMLYNGFKGMFNLIRNMYKK